MARAQVARAQVAARRLARARTSWATRESSGSALKSVRMIFLSEGTRLTIRSARSTRTARSTVRLPASGSMMRSHAEPTTMQSKMFQPCEKYWSVPRPKSLSATSVVNMYVKTVSSVP